MQIYFKFNICYPLCYNFATMKHLRKIFFFFIIVIFVLPSPASAKIQWGVYTDQNYDPLSITYDLEELLGKKFDNQLYYSALKDEFELTIANNIRNQGKRLQIALEVWDPERGTIQPDYRLKTITSGDHDQDITRWAKSLKNFGDIVYLTLMSEMNGNWMPWSGTANSNDPTDFVPAWHHVHNIFTTIGANNVRWVWTPNNESVPNIAANDQKVYYPGDSYVDYIGVNGYNFGQPINPWMSFYEIFMPFYQKITQITSSAKPIIIGEMACSETGGNKAIWINNMFQDLSLFPRIEQIYWFNINKERDWRINSSAASFEAFKANFNPIYTQPDQQAKSDITISKNKEVQGTTTKSTPIVSDPPNTDNVNRILGETTSSDDQSQETDDTSNRLPLFWIIIIIVSGIAIIPILYLIKKKYFRKSLLLLK